MLILNTNKRILNNKDTQYVRKCKCSRKREIHQNHHYFNVWITLKRTNRQSLIQQFSVWKMPGELIFPVLNQRFEILYIVWNSATCSYLAGRCRHRSHNCCHPFGIRIHRTSCTWCQDTRLKGRAHNYFFFFCISVFNFSWKFLFCWHIKLKEKEERGNFFISHLILVLLLLAPFEEFRMCVEWWNRIDTVDWRWG